MSKSAWIFYPGCWIGTSWQRCRATTIDNERLRQRYNSSLVVRRHCCRRRFRRCLFLLCIFNDAYWSCGTICGNFSWALRLANALGDWILLVFDETSSSVCADPGKTLISATLLVPTKLLYTGISLLQLHLSTQSLLHHFVSIKDGLFSSTSDKSPRCHAYYWYIQWGG